MIADRENGRAWVAKLKWDGAEKPFWFGTIFARLDAPHHEIEAAAWALFGEIAPVDIRRPSLVGLEPGSLVFIPEKLP